MDDRALQRWGVIVGGATAAAAFAAATLTAPEVGPAPIAPAVSAAPPAATPEPPGFQPAGDTAPPPARASAVSFVVRFEGEHPLAQAQAMEAQGRHQAAVAAARRALSARADLRGLCFNRFTVGGYEIVLEPCAPVSAAQRQAVLNQWQGRLSAMSGVEYAEPNVVAQPDVR